ncbi:MAG: hypothetical protein ACHQ53_14545, partial [Polyangiales bacterium]
LLARGDTAIAGFHPSPLLLFSFTSGRAADNHALMDAGALLPWWTDEHHLNAFFRPLSSLTHLLDFALFPERPWLMHLHSLCWFAALLLVVAHVYRHLGADRMLAMLGFALFALDGAHGMTLSWIANRNALVSATLALPALSAHHRYVARGYAPGAWLGPLCFALGLCAGEIALAVLGYLIAYSVVLDRSSLGRRALRLAPYFALLALWRGAYSWLELGSAGSGAYHDPGREPLQYALALASHLPVLLSAQLALPLADIWFWGPPEVHLPIWLISLASLGALAAAGHVLLREDDEARFWGLGMVLSGCAVAASVPGARLLLVPGLGGAALLAKLIVKLLPSSTEPRRSWAAPLLLVIVLLHAVISPVVLLVYASSTRVLSGAIARAQRGIPRGPEIRGRTVVVVNAPFDVLLSYVQVEREVERVPRPEHLYWLATASSELTLTTVDASSVRVRPARGFLLTAPERHYRGDPAALSTGASVSLSQMRVRVLETTADGRPAAAEFAFSEPLASPRYLFLRYDHGELVPFELPPPGSSARFPREDFFATLTEQALSGVGSL